MIFSKYRIFSKFLKNTKIFKRSCSFIGQGFYNNEFSPIVHKTIFENPDWYSAYTSYQGEISQGRLTLLYQYQNMIKMITGMDIANAGLLDHIHCIFESIQMLSRVNKKIKNQVIIVDKNIFENHYVILNNYENIIWTDKNITLKFVDLVDFNFNDHNLENIIGIIVQTVDKYGYYNKSYNEFTQLQNNMKNKDIDMGIVMSCDLLHHTVLKSPKELGANIVIGNLQRVGIPLWGGGPHSCFFSCDYKYLRNIPGKLVSKAFDINNNRAYRLALQTREQHIKRQTANSNICTNQNLLNLYSTAWLMNIGLNNFTKKMNDIINIKSNFFGKTDTLDTILIKDDKLDKNAYYSRNGINIYTIDDINMKNLTFINNLSKRGHTFIKYETNLSDYKRDKPIIKTSKNHLFFDLAGDPLELMRYLNKLQKQDFSLLSGMIPLGSCTMKYNPVETLNYFSDNYYLNIHPYEYDKFYHLERKLKKVINYLSILTGYTGTSIQPLSGSHSEFMSLCMIKKYFKNKKENNRKYIIIPESAHGTNPCSASIVGFEVLTLKQTQQGYLDLEHFQELLEKVGCNNIAGSMITYPSTYGIFDTNTKIITKKIKEIGGFNYLDGANMNAWIGKLHPNDLYFDIMHINMHKTLAIPHGGGGPGMGAICCNETLKQYLPNSFFKHNKNTIGQMSNTQYGNTLAALVTFNYLESIGNNNNNNIFNPVAFSKISDKAVENANYIVSQIEHEFSIPFRDKYNRVAHEFIIDCSPFLKYNINSTFIAKRIIDYSIHPPTLNWPVPNSLMFEVTETENDFRIQYLIDTLLNIKLEILNQPDIIINSPHSLSEIIENDWKYNYSREQAYYPLGKRTKDNKYLPIINHINDTQSDRDLLSKINIYSD
jgi:glycine dehydrogenase